MRYGKTVKDIIYHFQEILEMIYFFLTFFYKSLYDLDFPISMFLILFLLLIIVVPVSVITLLLCLNTEQAHK